VKDSQHLNAFKYLLIVCTNAPIKVLPHLPPCGQTRGITRGFDEKFGPRCGDLDNASNKGRDNPMEKASERRGFRPTILPEGGAIILRIRSNPPSLPAWGLVGQNFDRCIKG